LILAQNERWRRA